MLTAAARNLLEGRGRDSIDSLRDFAATSAIRRVVYYIARHLSLLANLAWRCRSCGAPSTADISLPGVAADPWLDALRDDPAFRAVVMTAKVRCDHAAARFAALGGPTLLAERPAYTAFPHAFTSDTRKHLVESGPRCRGVWCSSADQQFSRERPRCRPAHHRVGFFFLWQEKSTGHKKHRGHEVSEDTKERRDDRSGSRRDRHGRPAVNCAPREPSGFRVAGSAPASDRRGRRIATRRRGRLPNRWQTRSRRMKVDEATPRTRAGAGVLRPRFVGRRRDRRRLRAGGPRHRQQPRNYRMEAEVTLLIPR